MSTGWKTLNRDDLKSFDDHQTKAVLYAMSKGGVGRVSNNGHAIIRNQQGQTMSVSRSAGGRRKPNVANDLVRLFGAPIEDEGRRSKATGSSSSVTPTPDVEPYAATLECPASACPAVFATEGARYAHVQQKHPHTCDECGAAFATSKGRSGHRRIVHEGARPATGNRGRRPKPVESTPDVSTVEEPEVAGIDTTPTRWAPVHPAEFMATVRKMLGEDPRVAELSAKVDALTRERDDARAQLGLVKEAMGL